MSEIHLNPTDKKILKDAIVEMSNCMLRIESEREAMGDIASDLSKKFGIKKPIINKVVKAHHKHQYAEMQMDNDHFEFVYESLMGSNEDD